MDEKMKNSGRVVKFGAAQLNNPTPIVAKVVFRTILYIAAVWAIAAPVITEIPADTMATINKYLLLLVAIVNVTIKFFGWDYSDNN